jgi:hypothetical protein
MPDNIQDIETRILQISAKTTDAEKLREQLFGEGKLIDEYLHYLPENAERVQAVINKAFKRLKDIEFDEFKDKDYADWKRVRAAIEHENTLVNHRLNWLFSSQAFLFTAFTVLFNTWKNSATVQPGLTNSTTEIATKNQFLFLLILVALIGFFICLFIQRGLNAAEDHLQDLDKWWYREFDNSIPGGLSEWSNREKRKELMNLQRPKHPPLQGWAGRNWSRWFNYSVTPVLFLTAWFLIFLLIVLDVSSPIAILLIEAVPKIISYLFFAVLIVILVRLYDRTRKKP